MMPTTVDSAVLIHDTSRRFGQITAIDHLSLAIQPGELFGVLGPDGAGKTTLLRLIAAVLDPTDPSAHGWRGRVEQADPSTDRAGRRRRVRHGDPASARQSPAWLHAADLRLVRRSLGRRKPDLRRRHLRRPGARARRPLQGTARFRRTGAVPRPPRRRPFRRHEEEARARLRADPPPADSAARRADHRRRSGRAARFLGLALAPARAGDHRHRHHALHGRSRALQPRRPADRRARAGAGDAAGDQGARARLGAERARREHPRCRTRPSGSGWADRHTNVWRSTQPDRERRRRARPSRSRPPIAAGRTFRRSFRHPAGEHGRSLHLSGQRGERRARS